MDTLGNTPVTQCLIHAALAAGTTTTINTTGTTHYAIRGLTYTKAALSNTATPTTDAATGLAFPALSANEGTVVVIGYDKDGNVKACQGTIEELNSSGAFVRAPQFPGIPSTMCPIGYIILKAGSTLASDWTFGSSNLSSVTGMTYTFRSVNTLPARPQIA